MLVEATKNIGENATVNKLVSIINAFPEYRNAETKIQVRLGSRKTRIGKLAISHAAYTNGGFDVAKAYYEHGIDTLSYIHISEPDLTKLASLKLDRNLIILGHIASDWLGINRLLRELEKNDVESIPTTELIFSRK